MNAPTVKLLDLSQFSEHAPTMVGPLTQQRNDLLAEVKRLRQKLSDMRHEVNMRAGNLKLLSRNSLNETVAIYAGNECDRLCEIVEKFKEPS